MLLPSWTLALALLPGLAAAEDPVPDGFRAAGSQAWLFLDEILVNPQDDD